MLVRLGHLVRGSSVSYVEGGEGFFRGLGLWESQVMLSSEQLGVHLNLVYQPEDLQPLLQKLMKPKRASVALVADWMNECCNLVAGLIQRKLREQGIGMEMSVPFASELFVDFPSADTEGGLSDTFYFDLDGAPLRLNCSIRRLGPALPSYEYHGVEDRDQELKDIFEF
jgi:hypothetical protein